MLDFFATTKLLGGGGVGGELESSPSPPSVYAPVYCLYIDQIKNDEETLHVIMSKEVSIVNNNFWTMFICNFRESLPYRMPTQNDSGQPLWVPKKYPKKWSREDFFYKLLN